MSLDAQAQRDVEDIYAELYSLVSRADYVAAAQVLKEFECRGGSIESILNDDLSETVKNGFSRYLSDNGK